MTSTKIISIQGTAFISDFISSLSLEGDLHTKTLTQYTSDLKDFIYWFENVWGNHAEDTIFYPTNVTARTITRYREHMQINRSLKILLQSF